MMCRQLLCLAGLVIIALESLVDQHVLCWSCIQCPRCFLSFTHLADTGFQLSVGLHLTSADWQKVAAAQQHALDVGWVLSPVFVNIRAQSLSRHQSMQQPDQGQAPCMHRSIYRRLIDGLCDVSTSLKCTTFASRQLFQRHQ